jgi:serine acetyltransferase
VPPNATAVGIPARMILREEEKAIEVTRQLDIRIFPILLRSSCASFLQR